MAETEYSTTANLPVEEIWSFVRDMDNWAAFVPGYQAHEKRSETDSVWTLKGDVGSLQRTLTFEVRITEWAGPERVSFELAGVNEPLKGAGSFRMGGSDAASAAPPPPKGLFARLAEAIVRLFVRRGRAAPRAEAGGGGTARLTFALRLQPGGPMAPMIDAMIRPAMAVAAEDLANAILGHLEGRQRD